MKRLLLLPLLILLGCVQPTKPHQAFAIVGTVRAVHLVQNCAVVFEHADKSLQTFIFESCPPVWSGVRVSIAYHKCLEPNGDENSFGYDCADKVTRLD